MPSAFLLLFETTLLLLLFRFFIVYLHFFKYNALSVGSATEGIGLPSCTQMSLLVVFVSPTLVTTMVDVLSGCTETSWFTWKKRKIRKHENMSHQTMFFSLKINTKWKWKLAHTHTYKHKASVVTFILLSCDGGKKKRRWMPYHTIICMYIIITVIVALPTKNTCSCRSILFLHIIFIKFLLENFSVFFQICIFFIKYQMFEIFLAEFQSSHFLLLLTLTCIHYDIMRRFFSPLNVFAVFDKFIF